MRTHTSPSPRRKQTRQTGSRSAPLGALLLAAGLGGLGVVARSGQAAEVRLPGAILPLPPAPPVEATVPHLDWSRVTRTEGRYSQREEDGGRLDLTLDAGLTDAAERALATSGGSYGAAVLLSVEDGRLLALAGRTRGVPEESTWDLATRPWAPAASVFKLVTAAALVEEGVTPEQKVCYHGGVHSVEESNLTTHARWDSTCAGLAYGVAKSQNAILARLAVDHLRPERLDETARALGFGAPVGPAELLGLGAPLAASEVRIPADSRLAFARTAAGFWSTTLSPLQGAVLAATFARGGVTPPLHLIERAVDSEGHEQPAMMMPPRRVLDEGVARTVGRMMVGTTDYGTARTGFHDKQSGRPTLPGIAVAGKTGSLFRRGACTRQEVGCAGDFLAYSWFVGFAPADEPRVAVSVLIGSDGDAKKAHQVASELLTRYFKPQAEAPVLALRAPARHHVLAHPARHPAPHRGRTLVARR